MTTLTTSAPEIAAATDLVPDSFPPHEPAPVRAWGVYWLFAPVLGWLALLLPRRLGPRLACSSFAAAYWAHFVGLAVPLLLGGALAFVLNPPSAAPMTWSEALRFWVVMLLLTLLDEWRGWQTPLFVGLVVVGAQAAIWLGAMLYMPWHAAGERGGRLYLRSVKLVLWSTTPLIVVPLFVAVVSFGGGPWWDSDVVVETAAALGGLWAFWVVLRWGDRYAGPPDGPGFRPRPLRCETCGYPLSFLPRTGRCPECGRPIVESLPQRRRVPRFASARGPLAWLGAFFVTLAAALLPWRFGQRLAVHRGRGAARIFALLVCLLCGALFAGGLAPLIGPRGAYMRATLEEIEINLSWAEYGLIVLVGCVPIALIAAAVVYGLLILTAWGITGCGWFDAARRGLIVCYASPWLLLPTVLGVAGSWGCYFITEVWRPRFQVHLPLFGSMDAEVPLTLLTMLPAGATLLMWFVPLRRLLAATRYANA